MPWKAPDRILAAGRRHHHPAAGPLGIELRPGGQAGAGTLVGAGRLNAALLEGELEAVRRQGQHHLLGLAQGVSQQHRDHVRVQRPAAEQGQRLHDGIRVRKPEMGLAVGALQDQDLGLGHGGVGPAPTAAEGGHQAGAIREGGQGCVPWLRGGRGIQWR